ncbi:MAG: hypothetical protein RIQ81_2461 [Pseudomonadota bacterium]
MKSSSKWIYDDSLVACGSDGILVRNFYFPSRRARKIAWTEIRSARRKNLGLLSGKWRIWGMDLQRIWFHRDLMRPFKQEAIVIDVGGLLKIGITPKDLEKVFAIIKQRTGA